MGDTEVKENPAKSVALFLHKRAAADIIGCAHSNYWLSDYAPEWDNANCVLKLGRAAGTKVSGSTEKAKCLRIGHAEIADALSRMLAGACEGGEGRQAACDIVSQLSEDGTGADGVARDCVLQIAVFGRIAYG